MNTLFPPTLASIFLLFALSHSIAQNSETLFEGTIKIPGVLEETKYFGLHEGDEVIFTYKEINGKSVKEVDFGKYGGSPLFAEFKTSGIHDKTINIAETGVYFLKFYNSAIGGRVVQLSIKRTPGADAPNDFKSSIVWKDIIDSTITIKQERYKIKEEYKTVELVPPTQFYANSTSNEFWKGGDATVDVAVRLPKNTVEWYYEIAASRNKDDIAQVGSTFNLLSDLSMALDQTGAIGFGIELLSQPPGANFCSSYLFDQQNRQLFNMNEAFRFYPEGSRENIKSGIIKMPYYASATPLYIGIRNSDSMHGIHVAIQVVAITLEEEWGMKDVEVVNTTSRKVPMLTE